MWEACHIRGHYAVNEYGEKNADSVLYTLKVDPGSPTKTRDIIDRGGNCFPILKKCAYVSANVLND